jgi:predicted dehydrogenase
LRFAIVGTGFWSRFQLAGWKELDGVECVALCDRTGSKAEKLAREFGVPAVYDDAEELLRRERLDFLDIITDAHTHGKFVRMAADRRLPVICQKPLAPSYSEAEGMVAACREAGVPLLVHENWRWQTQIRQMKRVLDEGRIGKPFRARIDFISSFPVFNNQPFLRELEQFILTDIGTHLLDVARCLFGEAEGLTCLTHRVHRDTKGEDVATVLLAMKGGAAVVCNMAYAGNALEHDRFPETYIFVEAESGSAELGPDYWLRVTTGDGTFARRYPPPRHAWADPSYEVIHASIVPCHANLLAALRGEGRAETTGEDNLLTLKLVFAAYESAAGRRSIHWSRSNLPE